MLLYHIYLKNQYGKTALMWASENGHNDIVALLKKSHKFNNVKTIL
ncbi:MAG: hypothetical protein H6845_01295 [Alphaproteobacteria bacterium]|nr:MAG: hypothetical protein H6845_01295 [Alphaproteobacteria bacterium]